MLERAGDDGGGVLVVVDGVFSMEGDIAPLPRIVELCQALRRAADGRRGARRRRARRARRGRRASCSASRPTSTCGWARSRKSLASCGGFIAGPHEVIDFLRIQLARVPVHRLRRAGRGRRRARRAADHPLPRGAGAVRPRARQRRATCTTGCTSSASRSSTSRSGVTSRRSCPVVVGDDWKAVLLWRALYDAGVYVNVAIHPAVPPGGALLRTSVMATHDRADARPRARALRKRQADLRGRARTASARTVAHSTDSALARDFTRGVDKSRALCECCGRLSVDITPADRG